MPKLTVAQKHTLKALTDGFRVSGRFVRSIRALEAAGYIKDVRCIPVVEGCRNYAKDYYEATVVKQAA